MRRDVCGDAEYLNDYRLAEYDGFILATRIWVEVMDGMETVEEICFLLLRVRPGAVLFTFRKKYNNKRHRRFRWR